MKFCPGCLHKKVLNKSEFLADWVGDRHTANPVNGANEFISVISAVLNDFNPYPTAFPYWNGMVLHFYQQQESSTTKTVHKVINKGLKAYV